MAQTETLVVTQTVIIMFLLALLWQAIEPGILIKLNNCSHLLNLMIISLAIRKELAAHMQCRPILHLISINQSINQSIKK